MKRVVNFLIAVYPLIVSVLKRYPAASAALLNVGVILVGYLGFHVTGADLVYMMTVATTLFGVIVHTLVSPVSKSVGKDVQ